MFLGGRGTTARPWLPALTALTPFDHAGGWVQVAKVYLKLDDRDMSVSVSMMRQGAWLHVPMGSGGGQSAYATI